MLTDQVFQPKPIITLGPEFFAGEDHVYFGIDLITVSRLRLVQALGLFRLWFLALSPSRYPWVDERADRLARLGLHFDFVLYAGQHDISAMPATSKTQSIRDAVLMADAVYSPEFTTYCTPWFKDEFTDGEKLLRALEDFIVTAEPYSKAALIKRYNLWT